MKDINYLEIIKKSWRITWENKYLWWFGLFLALGGGFNFNFNFPSKNEWQENMNGKEEIFTNFLSQHWKIVIILVILLVLIGIILFILSVISQAGLLKTLSKIEKNEKGNFKEGFFQGKKYFWKILGIGFTVGILIFFLALVLSLPVALLFYLKSMVFGILAAILALVIFVPSLILTVYIRKYACFFAVLSDLGIKSSLENGYQIFRKNIFSSIIMALFFIPINIAMFILVIGLILVVGLIFLLIGIILNLIIAKIGIWIAVTLGVLAFLVLVVFAGSIFQVFSQTVWFLFFGEIAKVKEEQKEEVLTQEKKTAQETIPSPEKA